jgi:hypothetical protein
VRVNAIGYSAGELELCYGMAGLLSPQARAEIKSKAMNLVTIAFMAGVFFPGLYMFNFLIDRASAQVKLTRFETTYDPRSHGMGDDDKKVVSRNAVEAVGDLFGDLGF